MNKEKDWQRTTKGLVRQESGDAYGNWRAAVLAVMLWHRGDKDYDDPGRRPWKGSKPQVLYQRAVILGGAGTAMTQLGHEKV